MRILYMLWDSLGTDDVVEEFKKRGYEVEFYRFNRKQDVRLNKEIAEKIIRTIAEKEYEFVFSFNYFPVISLACNSCQIKYISWVYDSPLPTLYSNTIYFPYNYVFIFDKADYLDLCKKGIETVYYLPLAAAVSRYDSYEINEEIKNIYNAPISFVGSTYSERKHLIYKNIFQLDAHTRGYIEGIIQAQKIIYGKNILEDMLTPEIIDKLQTIIPRGKIIDSFESVEWFYARFFLAKYLTVLERQEILELLSENYEVALYTHRKTPSLPKIVNKGTAAYQQEAYYIYHSSKINLNITLRSISSGIPLRAFDIMGSQGFLLTNYQEDFLDFFIPGEDFVYFDSYEDLLKKVDYYLNHEEERKAIAMNGYKKVKEYHTYKERVDFMLQVVDQ